MLLEPMQKGVVAGEAKIQTGWRGLFFVNNATDLNSAYGSSYSRISKEDWEGWTFANTTTSFVLFQQLGATTDVLEQSFSMSATCPPVTVEGGHTLDIIHHIPPYNVCYVVYKILI